MSSATNFRKPAVSPDNLNIFLSSLAKSRLDPVAEFFCRQTTDMAEQNFGQELLAQALTQEQDVAQTLKLKAEQVQQLTQC